MRTQQRAVQMRPSFQGGFTLIELMISLLLGILVIGGVTSVFMSNKQAYITNNALSQVQDSSRISFEMMARDIRETGLTGCGNTFILPGATARTYALNNVLNNGPYGSSAHAWWADLASNTIVGFDASVVDPAVTSGTGVGQRVAATSSIELVSADGQGVSITNHAIGSGTFTVSENTTNFKAGDIAIICDDDHAAIGQISTYTPGTNPTFVIAAGGSSPGNCLIGLGYILNTSPCTSPGISYQYAATGKFALASKLYASDWYIGNNPIGTTSLYRMTLVNTSGVPTATAQEMVRNVLNLTITYHVSGAASYVSAAAVGTNWSIVDSAILKFQVQSAAQYTNTVGKALTKQIYMTVTLRNRV